MDEPSEKPRDIRERSFAFALEVVRLCQQLERHSDVFRTIGRQLLRSGTSIGANIEEAQGAQSRPDFISKYGIALKEARETLYWLRILRGVWRAPDDGIARYLQEADEIARIIGAIVVKSKNNQRR